MNKTPIEKKFFKKINKGIWEAKKWKAKEITKQVLIAIWTVTIFPLILIWMFITEEYPCSLCYAENDKRNQQRNQEPPHQEYDALPPLGLTKREYFAAMAMQGLLANYVANDDAVNDGYPFVHEKAVQCADVLIKQLSNQ